MYNQKGNALQPADFIAFPLERFSGKFLKRRFQHVQRTGVFEVFLQKDANSWQHKQSLLITLFSRNSHEFN